MKQRLSVLLALTVALAVGPASGALARPVSTYSLDSVHGSGLFSGSTELTVDESGTAQVHFTQMQFVLLTCDGGTGSVQTVWTADGAATTTTLSVDRKLSQFSWSGDVVVTTVVTTTCPGETQQVETTVSTETFTFSGSSSSRLVRDRVGGNRVLLSSLDQLSVVVPAFSGPAGGMLTETISNG